MLNYDEIVVVVINEKHWYKHRFEWQKGYGAFSVSYYNRPKVINCIKNQQKHQQQKSFADEYLEILNQFDIPIDDKTIFEPLV